MSRQDQRSVGLGPLRDAFTMIYLSFREQREDRKKDSYLSFLFTCIPSRFPTQRFPNPTLPSVVW